MPSDYGAVYVSGEEEDIIEAHPLEAEEGERWVSEGVLIRDWAEELAKPTEFNNGVAACPYALQAIEAGEVKTIVAGDLWAEVLAECSVFLTKGNKVTMLFDTDFDGTYDQLEDQCLALNKFFSLSDIDIWLLCYLGEEAVVFVQRWTELENAAAKLEKLGYYINYDDEDYRRHILARRERKL